jgi:hypothetical protein
MVRKLDDPKTARMSSIEDNKISTIGEQSNERTLAQQSMGFSQRSPQES